MELVQVVVCTFLLCSEAFNNALSKHRDRYQQRDLRSSAQVVQKSLHIPGPDIFPVGSIAKEEDS
jgi:hypothetical protein